MTILNSPLFTPQDLNVFIPISSAILFCWFTQDPKIKLNFVSSHSL
ncbi:hypothetical protein Sps_01496 [Shewanella psychrophila]|uniref:Uncharacterized protein n=1 Tax=Shewanella psychrophila TaxID=225848 RepID=A0A1S6HMC9_9GAMM|nr:hypothetical protein Sps_01496 [Shewanella psychrophila]